MSATTGRAAELLEQAEANAREILAHCERRRAYLAPNQRELIDRNHDFIAATDALALAASLRLALTVVEAAKTREWCHCNVIKCQCGGASLDAALAAFERAGTDTNNETAE